MVEDYEEQPLENLPDKELLVLVYQRQNQLEASVKAMMDRLEKMTVDAKQKDEEERKALTARFRTTLRSTPTTGTKLGINERRGSRNQYKDFLPKRRFRKF